MGPAGRRVHQRARECWPDRSHAPWVSPRVLLGEYDSGVRRLMSGQCGNGRATVLVSTGWVAERLSDPDVCVIQVDEDPLLYELGHLPGAAIVRWDHDLQADASRDVVDAEGFAALMGRLGCGRRSTVVLYGDWLNGWAAYAYWVLKYWGHPDVRIMDGGHQKWTREGRDLTTAVPVAQLVEYPIPEPCPEVRAYLADVRAAIGDPRIAVIDARSEAQYRGAINPAFGYPLTGAHRGGHVPGATNVPWMTLTDDDGCFRSDAELRDLFVRAGVDLGGAVVTYCIIGVGSSAMFFVLRELLGVPDVRNYDGSWMEWGSSIRLPIECHIDPNH